MLFYKQINENLFTACFAKPVKAIKFFQNLVEIWIGYNKMDSFIEELLE